MSIPNSQLIKKPLLTSGSVLLFMLISSQSLAYRPFDSTDAAVIADQEFEIEFGVFSWQRSKHEDISITPQLVINYGLSDSLELIAEFEIEHPHGEDSQLVNPGIFIKSVFKEGVLQDQEGLSFAGEAGLLLPSSAEGQDNTGFEAIGIISGQVADFNWHLNLGAGIDREDQQSFALSGLIIEFPAMHFDKGDLRFAGELNVESKRGESAETSALIGLLWEPAALPELTLDVGIRQGISDTAADWGVSLGFSFSF